MNLLSPYKIKETDKGYEFKTAYGAVYELNFMYYPLLNDDILPYRVFMFNVERITKGKSNKDLRIQITVEHALSLFFNGNINAIIVVFDSLDGKQDARKRLFVKWYSDVLNNNVEKYEAACQTNQVSILTMLLVENQNPFRAEIVKNFYALVEQNFYY